MNKRFRAKLIAQQQRRVRTFFDSHCMVWEAAIGNKVQCVDANFNHHKISPTLMAEIGSVEVNWTVYCCVMLREKNGKRKLAVGIIPAPRPCKHHEIQSNVAQEHLKFMDSLNLKDCIVSAGWVVTGGVEVTDEQMYDYFDQLGVWSKLMAPWEVEQNAC